MITRRLDLNQKLRYCEYGRFSSDMQNPRSIDQQFNEISQQVKRGRYSWQRAGTYSDSGISGRYIGKRSDFMKMLADIRSGRINVDLIVVDTLERFGRMQELESIRRELYDVYGVVILTVDSGFADPTTPQGQAYGMLEAMRAKSDASAKAHNVLRGKKDSVKMKHWPGGPPPAGYKLQQVTHEEAGRLVIDHSVLAVDPILAPIVKMMFSLYVEDGWGCTKISKHLNSKPELVATWGKAFNASTIGRIFKNEIYTGRRAFGKVSTDVVSDRRVVQANAPDSVMVVEDYCEPIIAPEVWAKAQVILNKRGEAVRKARTGRESHPGKAIRPLGGGISLKCALAGIVVCAECGAAMQPRGSSTRATDGTKYTYYNCPNYHHGSCSNKHHPREDKVWSAVVSRLRSNLFPAQTKPEGESELGSVPEWFGPVVAEVRRELEAQFKAQQTDSRPALQEELKRINKQRSGWAQSLGNPDLVDEVRSTLEEDLSQAVQRQRDIESELEQIEVQSEIADEMLDPRRVVDCLQELDNVLGEGNPTLVNLELSRHIERIEVFADRRIVMRTCKLGCFEGVVQMLSASTTSLSSSPPTVTKKGHQVKARKRSRRRSGNTDLGKSLSHTDISPEDVKRFAALAVSWFWEDEFVLSGKTFWAAENAQAVAAKREAGLNQRQLAEYFEVTRPTIRHALKIFAERSGGNADEDDSDSPEAA